MLTTEIQERTEIKWQEAIFQEIIAKNFPKLKLKDRITTRVKFVVKVQTLLPTSRRITRLMKITQKSKYTAKSQKEKENLKSI